MWDEQLLTIRELDGAIFPAIVLRSGQTGDQLEADIAYLDDGNVERDVPADELAKPDGDYAAQIAKFSQEDISRRYTDGLAILDLDDKAHALRPATPSHMRWEQGRYVAEDGAVIYTADAQAPRGADRSFGKIVGQPVCGPGLKGIRLLRRSLLEAAQAALEE